MVDDKKAKQLLTQIARKCCDSLGYGTKVDAAFTIEYKVGKKRMTLSEYQDYCVKKLLKKFDIKEIPDVKNKIQEYICELDQEIEKCDSWIGENMNSEACSVTAMESRLKTLTEVKNDLQSRLEGMI